MRYFFDSRDGDRLLTDDIGIELDSLHSARDEATRGIADFAKDAIPGAERRKLSIKVRDEFGRDVFKASVCFEVERLV